MSEKQLFESIDFDSNEMQVLCDPGNARFEAFQQSVNDFADSLDGDERRYMQLVVAAANIGLAEHGATLVDEIDLLGEVDAYEDKIRDILGEEYVEPSATGFFCIRVTVRFNCATRIFRC